jgi:predicted PurR-regulated permease PerM
VTKKLIEIGIAVLTTLMALLVLWQLRIVVVYVLISLMLAAAMRPMLKRLEGRSILVRAAWILLYIMVLGSFGLLLFLSGKSAISEIQQLGRNLSVQDVWKLPIWLEGTVFQHTLIERLPPPSAIFKTITGDKGQLVLPALLGFSQGIGGVVTGVLVILFMSIYWSINQVHFERLWLSLLPSDLRKKARGIWRTVEPEIGAYIRSQVIQSLLAGLLLGFGYWLLGSSFPSFLALVGALAFLIPAIGVPFAVIPVLLVGLLTSAQLSLFTSIYALAVLIAIGIWVKPRLFDRRWENLILTIAFLIALADAFGLVGIIVAPILSVVIQILWSRLVSQRAVLGAADQISDLKERQARVREIIETIEETPLPLVTSSMGRLSDLIEKAEPVLIEAIQAQKSNT